LSSAFWAFPVSVSTAARSSGTARPFPFQIATDNQEETDRYWNAIVGNGGKESQCGWCKDRWGLSWQITPRALTEALAAGGGEAKRAFEAMMPMKKIDIATIEAARRG
jgi:predicted 3-demethylubiquinone-9 3-methyltransferase (glyoxalase superfamily)